MKKLAIFLLFLFFASPLLATNRTVKAGGGGDCTVIQTCVNLMAAGDTTTVFAGTYNENVTLASHPGTAGNYVTLQVNPSDTVNVFSFTMASHTKVIGFTITNPSSPASASCISVPTGTTDFFVTNNTITQCGSGNAMISFPSSTTGSTFGYFQGNIISWGCSIPSAPDTCTGMVINGSNILVENNDFSHLSDGITLFANHNVIRGNTWHDMLTSECVPNSHGGNCHIDAIESEPVTASQGVSAFNLYEGNTINNITGGGTNNHLFLTQGDGCSAGQCKNTIMRFNLSAHIGSATGNGYGILDQLGGYLNVKTYNNTTACNGNTTDQSTDFFADNSTGALIKNSIYYYCQSVNTMAPFAIFTGATGVHDHNLGFCTGSCSWDTFFTSDTGTLTSNPLFVNPGSDDYHLQSGSPARQAGSSLTNAVGSGSGSTSLTVGDAGVFSDGEGMTGVGQNINADWIRIGAATTVQISSINYGTNVITLASPQTWSNNDGIYLYKNSNGTVVLNGAAPDMGALPFQSAPVSTPNSISGGVKLSGGVTIQ